MKSTLLTATRIFFWFFIIGVAYGLMFAGCSKVLDLSNHKFGITRK